MRHLPITPHRLAAIGALAMTVAVLGDCSSSSLTPLLRNTVASSRHLTAGGYNPPQTVDYPTSPAVSTQLTGINNSGEVIGNYNSSYTSGSGWNSFTSQSPYSSFPSVQFPYNNAASTYMYAISNDSSPILVGYVLDPTSQMGEWGVVRNLGLWSITLRVKTEKNCNSTSEQWRHALLGYDSITQNAVGYYTDHSDSCKLKPFELKPGDNNVVSMFNNVPSGWSNTEATGIASNGSNEDVVGTTTLNSGAKAGWFLSYNSSTSGTPTAFQCCDYTSGTNATTVNGIVMTTGSPPHELIVGSYVATDSNTYGFIYDKTANAWTNKFSALGSNYTVITGINGSQTICGWYLASGKAHGFVATFSGVRSKRHHRNTLKLPAFRG